MVLGNILLYETFDGHNLFIFYLVDDIAQIFYNELV